MQSSHIKVKSWFSKNVFSDFKQRPSWGRLSLCLWDVNILPDLLKHPVLCLEGLVCWPVRKNLSGLFHPESTHAMYIWHPVKQTGILSSLFAWRACFPGSWTIRTFFQFNLIASACMKALTLQIITEGGGGRQKGRNKLPRFCEGCIPCTLLWEHSCILLVWVIIKILFVNGQMMDPFNWKKLLNW